MKEFLAGGNVANKIKSHTREILAFTAMAASVVSPATAGANRPSGGAGLSPTRETPTGGAGLPGPLQGARANYIWRAENGKPVYFEVGKYLKTADNTVYENPVLVKGQPYGLEIGQRASNFFGAELELAVPERPYVMSTNPNIAKPQVEHGRLFLDFAGDAEALANDGKIYVVGKQMQ